MSKHVLLVFTDPKPGREEEFNSWYDDVHVPDVLGVSGFRAAQRFVAEPGMRGEESAHRYLAIYEIDDDDLPGAMKRLREAVAGMQLSDAMAPALVTYAFSAVGARIEVGDAESV